MCDNRFETVRKGQMSGYQAQAAEHRTKSLEYM
jgi:hypothetical protein